MLELLMLELPKDLIDSDEKISKFPPVKLASLCKKGSYHIGLGEQFRQSIWCSLTHRELEGFGKEPHTWLYWGAGHAHLSHLMTKPTKWHVCPAKTQISLGICPVWSVFALRMKKAWVLSYQLSRCPGWSESSLGAQSLCCFCHEVAH